MAEVELDPKQQELKRKINGLTGTVLLNHFSDFGKTGTS